MRSTTRLPAGSPPGASCGRQQQPALQRRQAMSSWVVAVCIAQAQLHQILVSKRHACWRQSVADPQLGCARCAGCAGTCCLLTGCNFWYCSCIGTGQRAFLKGGERQILVIALRCWLPRCRYSQVVRLMIGSGRHLCRQERCARTLLSCLVAHEIVCLLYQYGPGALHALACSAG